MFKISKSSLFTVFSLFVALSFSACTDNTYVQRESVNKQYKDYEGQEKAIIGIGPSIDERQSKANATIRLVGQYTLDDAMRKLSSTYAVAVRWGDAARKNKVADLVVSDLSFDEARSYLEDVYGIQIIREGERRLLIVPTRNTARIEDFDPGVGVPLAKVVRGLADQCGYNMVITENRQVLANTKITTNFKDVDCLEAFDAILVPHGLSLVDHGGHFTIEGLPQRQWVLNLYEPLRSDKQEVSYTSGIGADGNEEGGGVSSDSGGSAFSSTSGDRDLWTELENDLKKLVDENCTSADLQSSALPDSSDGLNAGAALGTSTSSSSGGSSCGYVRINRTVGLIQMRAPHTVLTQADAIVRRVEDIASRRLLVEARVVAVTRNRGFEQGGALKAGLNGNTAVSGGYEPKTTDTGTSLAGRLLSLVNQDTSAGVFGIKGNNLDAAVEILESFGTTYQLMQPTMEVMDRQRAVMIDGTNERYVIRTATTDSDTGLTSIDTEIKSQFVGIQFSVVAQIAEEGEPHTLAIQIPITDIDDTLEVTVQGSDPQTSDLIPIATTRLIDQKVRVRDGELKVIGGLTKTIAVDSESGVPLIRNIPVGGKLFNEESITYENVEFVVLLRVKRLY